jgi:hypothetical protein
VDIDGMGRLAENTPLMLAQQPSPFAQHPLSENIDQIRHNFRNSIAGKGGIISIEAKEYGGYSTLELISKYPRQSADPQRPAHGMDYLAELIFSFQNCSFSIEILYKEEGVTGYRDNEISRTKKLLSITLEEDGEFYLGH